MEYIPDKRQSHFFLQKSRLHLHPLAFAAQQCKLKFELHFRMLQPVLGSHGDLQLHAVAKPADSQEAGTGRRRRLPDGFQVKGREIPV